MELMHLQVRVVAGAGVEVAAGVVGAAVVVQSVQHHPMKSSRMARLQMVRRLRQMEAAACRCVINFLLPKLFSGCHECHKLDHK